MEFWRNLIQLAELESRQTSLQSQIATLESKADTPVPSANAEERVSPAPVEAEPESESAPAPESVEPESSLTEPKADPATEAPAGNYNIWHVFTSFISLFSVQIPSPWTLRSPD